MSPETIKRYRSELRLTRAELAKEMGVAERTIIRWELGQFKPHPIFLEKLRYLKRRAREKVAAQ